MRRAWRTIIVVCVSMVTLFPSVTHASPITKGLEITPVRQYLSIDAGTAKESSFVVANLTDKILHVNLLIEQFSVEDYTYDYTFSKPSNDWLRLDQSSLDLASGQSKTVRYTISVPPKSLPGGYYYTLLASAVLSSGGIKNTVQAANQLYLTVNGQLTAVSHLEASSIPWVTFGRNIPFILQPINTGNTYTFVYVSGQLHGPFTKGDQTSSGHILVPGHVRTLTGSIESPILPGVYRATYGYKTDSGWVIQQSHWIIYLPPWSIAFILAVLLLVGAQLRRRSTPKRFEIPLDSTDKDA